MSTKLELYEQLKPKLGETETRLLLEFIESTMERKAITKEDLALFEKRLMLDLTESKSDLINLTKLKCDLIKWMFVFWVSHVVVMTGIMFILLKTVK